MDIHQALGVLPEPSRGPDPGLRNEDGHRERNRFFVFRPDLLDRSRCARACTGRRATSRTWTASGCRQTSSPCRWIRSRGRRSERRRRRRCRRSRPRKSTGVGLWTLKTIFSTRVTRFLNSGDFCFAASSCCCCGATTSTGCRRRRWRRCCCRRAAWKVVRKISTFASCFGSVHAAGRSFSGAPRLRGLTSFSFVEGSVPPKRCSLSRSISLSLLSYYFSAPCSCCWNSVNNKRRPFSATRAVAATELSVDIFILLSLSFFSFFSFFPTKLRRRRRRIVPSMASVTGEKLGSESRQK